MPNDVRATAVKDTDPPFWVAWNQALASIRVRFWRQAITTAGVGLGIAFFTSMQIQRLADTSTDLGAQARSAWLAGTALLMCLVGITNSMLMSVTERYREIGTFKCLGASDSFIVKVFVLESLLLGFMGSLLGSVIGAGAMVAVVRMQGTAIGVGAWLQVVALGTGVGLLMTVVAAIAPAIQAARMPAAAALRVDV
ncbi:MAG: FtsX-like permease family protein [Fimbriimonadaceae bacterium]|nr:FtsX-like permease family protein [Fimbriimonadaceae bacterium]